MKDLRQRQRGRNLRQRQRGRKPEKDADILSMDDFKKLIKKGKTDTETDIETDTKRLSLDEFLKTMKRILLIKFLGLLVE